MNSIKWTAAAEETYLTILTTLREEWNDDVAYNFYEAVDGLATFKNLCPISPKYQFLRRCVLNKHCSFTYQVEGNDIKIVAFYYNKMDW
jgi:plasmid stabilization system protein ParE